MFGTTESTCMWTTIDGDVNVKADWVIIVLWICRRMPLFLGDADFRFSKKRSSYLQLILKWFVQEVHRDTHVESECGKMLATVESK